MVINTTTRTSDYGTTIEVTDGKQVAQICIPHDMDRFGQINVICKNASHRAWKGMGRFFNDLDEAAAAYKSGFMKSAIEAARGAA